MTRERRRLRSVEERQAELEDRIRDLPEDWMACRDFKHAWNVSEDFHVTERTGRRIDEIRRVLVCLRCGTERHETYHHTHAGLEKVAQHYAYPEGYQMRGVGAGVKPHALVQEERYRRVMARLAEGQRERA